MSDTITRIGDDLVVADHTRPPRDVDDIDNHLLGCLCDECAPDRKHDDA